MHMCNTNSANQKPYFAAILSNIVDCFWGGKQTLSWSDFVPLSFPHAFVTFRQCPCCLCHFAYARF